VLWSVSPSPTQEGRGLPVFYWVLKTVVLGPLLKLLFRPWVEGEEHIPEDGAATTSRSPTRSSCR